MAGDWIKMTRGLQTSPRVVRIMSALGADRFRVIGGLHAVWCLFDEHSADGTLDGYTPEALDAMLAWPGFAKAMEMAGWLQIGDGSLSVPRFDEHNGQSAKRRAQETQRKRTERADVSASDADKKRTREEKRREEEIDTSAGADSSSKSTTSVPCPYSEIVSAYHAALPSMPRVRLMSEERQRVLRKFWGWVLNSKKSDGTPRATNRDEALAWIAEYFARAEANDFLMGRMDKSGAHQNWTCDLDFLLSEKGKKHVIEKTRDAA